MGETVNIEDGELATRLLVVEKNIAAVVKTILPDEADALFAEKEKQIEELKKVLDVANRSNKLLTKQLTDQEAKITTLTAKK